MNPESRRAAPSGGSGRPGSSRRPGHARSAPPPNALFAEMLRAARELLAVRSPLDAELMVSELLGTWWGQRGGGRRAATVEQLAGEGLVDYAGAQHSPAALALLSGIACLGTPRQATKAERAALELIESGVPCPGWAEHLGAVTSAECYINPDDLGDSDEVICTFSYAGEEPHALVSVVDYNADGMIKDGWVTSRVGKLLEHCRETSAQRGVKGSEGRYAFRQVEPGQAGHMLETALTVTDAASDPAVSGSFPSYHAFIRARIRALPPYRGRSLSATGERRHAWSRDRRALLAAEFLASDEAEDRADRRAARPCAGRGCRGGGPPSRSCRAGTRAPTCPSATRPTRTTGARCSPPTTPPRPPAGTAGTSSGTWCWPTGSGGATRPSCGRRRSDCWTRARTRTSCCPPRWPRAD